MYIIKKTASQQTAAGQSSRSCICRKPQRLNVNVKKISAHSQAHTTSGGFILLLWCSSLSMVFLNLRKHEFPPLGPQTSITPGPFHWHCHRRSAWAQCQAQGPRAAQSSHHSLSPASHDITTILAILRTKSLVCASHKNMTTVAQVLQEAWLLWRYIGCQEIGNNAEVCSSPCPSWRMWRC